MMTDFKPSVVLGVAAHPDDLDFGAAGTIAKFIQEGAVVYYLILTDGGKGTDDRQLTPQQLTSMRRNEQQAAAEQLGVKEVFFLDYPDCLLENTLEVKCDIARVIRKVKPDTVITIDPSFLYAADEGFINHPDHRAAGQATLDACFPLARDHLAFPELLAEGLDPHKVKTMLLINLQQNNYVVDVSETMPQKLKAFAAHASQVPDVKAAENMLRGIASRTGKAYNYTYAEGFMRIDIK